MSGKESTALLGAAYSGSISHHHAARARKATVKMQEPWQQRARTLSEGYLEDRLERALFRTSGVSSDVGTGGDPPNSDLLSLSDAVSPSSLFSDSDSCNLKRDKELNKVQWRQWRNSDQPTGCYTYFQSASAYMRERGQENIHEVIPMRNNVKCFRWFGQRLLLDRTLSSSYRICSPWTVKDASQLLRSISKCSKCLRDRSLLAGIFTRSLNPRADLQVSSIAQIRQKERPPSRQAQGFQTDFSSANLICEH